jgi:class 3 adenylate cyclase
MAGERTQRRLAAILAADVVGCSRLMAEDADVWQAINIYFTGLILEFTAEVVAVNWLRSNAQLGSSGGLEPV